MPSAASCSKEARPCLVKLLKQKHLASDLRKEAIWSLGEIGGEQVVELLEALLDNADDDEEYMLLEEAIDKANLVNETSNFELLKVDESDQDHQDHSHNLEEDEDDLPEDDFDDEEWNRYVDEDDLADEEDEESYDFEDPLKTRMTKIWGSEPLACSCLKVNLNTRAFACRHFRACSGGGVPFSPANKPAACC